MAKFFFHIRKRGRLISDPEGLELPDLDAAREEARNGIRQMVAAKVVAGEEADVVGIEICDDQHNDLATVTLAAAISATFPVSQDTFEVDLKKYLDIDYNPCAENQPY
jgi:hypothetical protein